MREVEIPGGTARFREQGKDEIPVRSEKILAAAYMSAQSYFPDAMSAAEGAQQPEEPPVSVQQGLAFTGVREASVVALLAEWTLPRPLPTLENIDQLPSDLYWALLGAVTDEDVAPDSDRPDYSPQPTSDGESPTTGSGDSPGPSATPEANLPTEPQPTTGESTAIAS